MIKHGRISDEAVKKATGRTWTQWFAILDKVGAKKMRHIDIARMLNTKYLDASRSTNVATSSGWWSQMVTVEYERARGLRKVNENITGFLVAIHKTVEIPVEKIEKAWSVALRSKGVAAKKLERLPSKSKRRIIRYKTKEGGLVVAFDRRSNGKSRIMVEAIRLSNASAVERERAFWKKILAALH